MPLIQGFKEALGGDQVGALAPGRDSRLWTEDALVVQPTADVGDVAFSLTKRIGGGVHRVIARHELVRVLDG